MGIRLVLSLILALFGMTPSSSMGSPVSFSAAQSMTCEWDLVLPTPFSTRPRPLTRATDALSRWLHDFFVYVDHLVQYALRDPRSAIKIVELITEETLATAEFFHGDGRHDLSDSAFAKAADAERLLLDPQSFVKPIPVKVKPVASVPVQKLGRVLMHPKSDKEMAFFEEDHVARDKFHNWRELIERTGYGALSLTQNYIHFRDHILVRAGRTRVHSVYISTSARVLFVTNGPDVYVLGFLPHHEYNQLERIVARDFAF